MTGCNWEVTLSRAVRENFSEETTFKFNNYELYIHGKIGKDYQRSPGSRQDQIYEGLRGGKEGGNSKKPQPEPQGGKDTSAKGGLVRRASSRVTRHRELGVRGEHT